MPNDGLYAKVYAKRAVTVFGVQILIEDMHPVQSIRQNLYRTS